MLKSKLIYILLVGLIITGCNSGGGDGDTTTDTTDNSTPTISTELLSDVNFRNVKVTYFKDQEIPNNQIVYSGDGTGIVFTPLVVLPDGLSLSTSGILSGVPTSLSNNAFYSVRVKGQDNEVVINIQIAVQNQVPKDVLFPVPVEFSVGNTGSFTPEAVGENISYELEPRALPIGLTFDEETGIISGTSNDIEVGKSYKLIARNESGSSSFNFTLKVNDTAPRSLFYNHVVDGGSTRKTKFDFFVGENIGSIIADVSGGTPLLYTLESIGSAVLPLGLSFNLANGSIIGTPFEATIGDIPRFRITAFNSGGSSSTEISFSVTHKPVENFNYDGNEFILEVDKDISPINIIDFSGGKPTLYTVDESTPLPLGLSLNNQDGTISGKPSTSNEFKSNTIRIKGTNPAGSVISKGITIRIVDQAPLDVSYGSREYTIRRNHGFSKRIIENIGGAIISIGLEDSSFLLPPGLTVNVDKDSPDFGLLEGNPTIEGSFESKITYENSGGKFVLKLDFNITPLPSYRVTKTLIKKEVIEDDDDRVKLRFELRNSSTIEGEFIDLEEPFDASWNNIFDDAIALDDSGASNCAIKKMGPGDSCDFILNINPNLINCDPLADSCAPITLAWGTFFKTFDLDLKDFINIAPQNIKINNDEDFIIIKDKNIPRITDTSGWEDALVGFTNAFIEDFTLDTKIVSDFSVIPANDTPELYEFTGGFVNQEDDLSKELRDSLGFIITADLPASANYTPTCSLLISLNGLSEELISLCGLGLNSISLNNLEISGKVFAEMGTREGLPGEINRSLLVDVEIYNLFFAMEQGENNYFSVNKDVYGKSLAIGGNLLKYGAESGLPISLFGFGSEGSVLGKGGSLIYYQREDENQDTIVKGADEITRLRHIIYAENEKRITKSNNGTVFANLGEYTFFNGIVLDNGQPKEFIFEIKESVDGLVKTARKIYEVKDKLILNNFIAIEINNNKFIFLRDEDKYKVLDVKDAKVTTHLIQSFAVPGLVHDIRKINNEVYFISEAQNEDKTLSLVGFRGFLEATEIVDLRLIHRFEDVSKVGFLDKDIVYGDSQIHQISSSGQKIIYSGTNQEIINIPQGGDKEKVLFVIKANSSNRLLYLDKETSKIIELLVSNKESPEADDSFLVDENSQGFFYDNKVFFSCKNHESLCLLNIDSKKIKVVKENFKLKMDKQYQALPIERGENQLNLIMIPGIYNISEELPSQNGLFKLCKKGDSC